MTDNRHIIFGTAGHVDHGKSSLVLALTGTDPDRLAEEKEREMTIDLGFAFLPLPGLSEPAAIVDVPGHEMFVRNMVAGATGIDACILIVAADEGVMPQTVEHLDVLRFLQIPAGVIALTKIDKATPVQAAEATAQTRELVKGTFLESAKIMPVSSVTRAGLAELTAELSRIAVAISGRGTEGAFRLPIDRVFTLKGVGTVVTGTVISGAAAIGDDVLCLPQKRAVRVRALQVHGQAVQRITAGQRAALNLADVSKKDMERGDMLVTPGALEPTLMADVRLALSPKAPRPLVQRTRARVHHTTREVMARVILLEGESLRPGETALVQLRLESPLVAAAGDMFVLRSYSPMCVIGGGTVVDPHPPKRRREAGAEDVAKREISSTQEVIIEALDRVGAQGLEFAKLQVHCGLPDAALRSAIDEMKSDQSAFAGRRDTWFSAGAVRDMQSAITASLARLHEAEPLRSFAPVNSVAGGAAPSPAQRECFRIALDLLRQQGAIAGTGERVRLATHQPKWSGKYEIARKTILDRCVETGLATPSPQEFATLVKLKDAEPNRVLDALVDAGDLRLLAPAIYCHPDVFARCREKVIMFLKEHNAVTVPQARDLLNASRKFLLPFLEELDREGVTVRYGDFRKLKA